MAAAIRAVRQQVAEDASLLLVCSAPRKSAPKSRDGRGASMHHDPPLSGDHSRDHENGSMSRKEPHNPPPDSSDDAESSSDEQSSSNPKISACKRRVGNETRAPNSARDSERDYERSAVRSEA